MEAEEFIPPMEAEAKEPEGALLPEQHAEEEQVGEKHCTDDVSVQPPITEHTYTLVKHNKQQTVSPYTQQ